MLFRSRVTAEYGGLHEWVLTLDVPPGTIDILRERMLVEMTDESTSDNMEES